MSFDTARSHTLSTHSLSYVQSSIRELVDHVIRPNATTIDREGRYPRENLNALAEEGWNGILLPTDLGGLGLNFTAFSTAVQEIARACPSTALIYTMHVGAAYAIYLYGSEDQWDRWLRPIRHGSIGTFSTSERVTGGHYWRNESEAVRTANGYLLNANKSFTTSGGYADFYVVQTKTPNAKAPDDLTYFIVDGRQNGITAGAWDALGVRGNHSGSLQFIDVHVEERDRLGKEGIGRDIIQNGVTYLIGLSATWAGTAWGILDEVTDHVKRTSHAHVQKQLADYQVIRSQLAEAKILLESSLAWQAQLASKLDEWQQSGQKYGPNEWTMPLTELKVHNSEVANRVAQIAMDVSGGYGYKRGTLERLYRDARAGLVMGPSNHLARELIGKHMLGLPLEMWYEGGD
ncbi:acyl-CoA dehydrogenase family protein [Alicyclobacillus acidoterrestris]|uniref:Acyl-CoA/acyl-ACP dehydrogenase n=1 Tax=Alicyclobacillus acidoterrestris (strain ATCC 49025 / DSM 3922 / CIP 106132 / NCIMB 13137 / GD3B) TaxID=1356854 RepID=T0CWB1_ALIAG|nr:acyl-CoA dehydrogenase family protein [Alicyclobacillus acidoterrestris]EPZ41821.1 hypothetical protein N007_16660 [Alicyclobacillus acidoterrestris ATCC 49025]UNO49585.1 acyl-CoA/acyl-ACP dehydrogenase [Alicyclobacillus acidoterrestris]